jgi:hypothetical protein
MGKHRYKYKLVKCYRADIYDAMGTLVEVVDLSAHTAKAANWEARRVLTEYIEQQRAFDAARARREGGA